MEELKQFDKVSADLAGIIDKGNFIPDCSTKEGYEASKRYVLDVTTKARSSLKDAHKKAKAFYLEGGRTIDAKKKELEQDLLDAESPHKMAYKAVDEEKKRIKAEKEARIQKGFDELRNYSESALNQSSGFIQSLIDDCSCFDCNPDVYGKEIQKIIELHERTMNSLTDAYTKALQFEDMQRRQAEIEAKEAELKAAEDERKRKQEEEERAVREAAQREEMRRQAEIEAQQKIEAEKLRAEQAEQARIEAEKQAEIDRIEAERVAKLQAEEAASIAAEQERQRIEAEAARVKAEEEAREADRKHRSLINNQALDCLVAGGVDKEAAKLAVKLIASKKVANVKINY